VHAAIVDDHSGWQRDGGETSESVLRNGGKINDSK
jgi:hypothetical protein